MKNVMKNLSAKLGNDWSSFVKDLYKCFEKMDVEDFLFQWEALKTSYPSTSAYLLRMERTKEKWAACYNRKIFMADIVSTQRGDSIISIFKEYLNINQIF